MKLDILNQKIIFLYNQYLRLWKENAIALVCGHLLVFLLLVSFTVYFFFLKAPSDFPEEVLFSVEEGQTLSDIAALLEKENIIKSAFWFKNTAIYLKGENSIKAGDYFFDSKENSYSIAKRMIEGEFDLTPIRVTVHEGLNIFEVSKLLENSLPNFNKEKFLKLAQEKEGYLFPDTYFFIPNTKVEKIISIMEENFYDKISELEDEIQNFGKPVEEVITLASIIETEARDQESRRTISGILWERLNIGMPLQVDVTFKYINGKNTYQLTSEDLQIDSPYNTYVYTGLPPTPIANPGLDSILAALNPIESDYLYFLSDRSGNMYYAKNFEEHINNRRFMNN